MFLLGIDARKPQGIHLDNLMEMGWEVMGWEVMEVVEWEAKDCNGVALVRLPLWQ